MGSSIDFSAGRVLVAGRSEHKVIAMHLVNGISPTPAASPWVANYVPNTRARLRLLCFPYAGGSASIYRAWASMLPPEIDVCAVQLPGRERRLREKPFTHLPQLIETLAEVLQPYLQMPFALFGHSMGSLITFELARELRRRYQLSPLHLFVSGHRAPQLPDQEEPVYNLPDAEFIEELRRLNGTPESVLQHPELLQLLLPVLRADFAMCETYVYAPEEPLSCPISAFGGLQDHEAGRADLAPWREQTTQSFSLRMFPGDHFFIHSDQQLLLQAVGQDLWQILSRLPAHV